MFGHDDADDQDGEPRRRRKRKKAKRSASGELRRRFESSQHSSEFPDHRSVALHHLQELLFDNAEELLRSALENSDNPLMQTRLLNLGGRAAKFYMETIAADDRHRKALRDRR